MILENYKYLLSVWAWRSVVVPCNRFYCWKSLLVSFVWIHAWKGCFPREINIIGPEWFQASRQPIFIISINYICNRNCSMGPWEGIGLVKEIWYNNISFNLKLRVLNLTFISRNIFPPILFKLTRYPRKCMIEDGNVSWNDYAHSSCVCVFYYWKLYSIGIIVEQVKQRQGMPTLPQ